MLDFKNIAIGFYNSTKNDLGISNSVIESTAVRRYTICLECPNIKDNNSTCGICGCVLKYKIRSNGKCPQEKW